MLRTKVVIMAEREMNRLKQDEIRIWNVLGVVICYNASKINVAISISNHKFDIYPLFCLFSGNQSPK